MYYSLGHIFQYVLFQMILKKQISDYNKSSCFSLYDDSEETHPTCESTAMSYSNEIGVVPLKPCVMLIFIIFPSQTSDPIPAKNIKLSSLINHLYFQSEEK